MVMEVPASVLYSMVATSSMCLLSTGNMANVTEGMNIPFYVILFTLHFYPNSHK